MMQADNTIPSENQLGAVVSGSLTHGIEVKLNSTASVEDMAVGKYVTIKGKKRNFFGMITDVTLGVVDEQINIAPLDASDPFLAEVLSGTSTFGTLHVLPMLTISSEAAGVAEGVQPVKTVPSHFSRVNVATQADVEMVFGGEDEKKFYIGTPLDMETRICLDLPEFAKRSNGIFGKSGTGKTFFTRILLIGMLQKSNAVNLIFDMQNEYGWMGFNEKGPEVKGLKQLFGDKVAVCALDEQHAKNRGISPDLIIKIGFDEIEPEDIVLLKQTLGFTDLAVEAVYSLHRKFGQNWLRETLNIGNEDLEGILADLNIHEGSFQNLRRGLGIIGRQKYMVDKSTGKVVDSLIKYLEKGMNVVLEFGRYKDITTYMLIANMFTRRIYARYQEKMEIAAAEKLAKPQPLVITIEEAHKFLNPEISNQTIFGTIAREMRKYNVTLLVIDQRPSGIDEEVMSQLGTKIAFLLDNERDVENVLAGVSGKNELRSVLARLEPKQQALIFGHSVPMPVVVRTREYGSRESYASFGSVSSRDTSEQVKKDIEDLWK